MPQKCFVDYETSPNFLLTSRHGVNFHFWGELMHETKDLNTVFFFFLSHSQNKPNIFLRDSEYRRGKNWSESLGITPGTENVFVIY